MPKPTRRPIAPAPPEVVDPRWILKALGLVLAVSIFCAYVTACLLFYRSQWQLAVSPSRAVASTPLNIGLAFTQVRFGTDATGQPQLSGWWIPSENPGARTVLLLHAGTGWMSDALPQARLLHAAGLNVLLFDYRGFGQSGGQHPTQALMQQDTGAALHYLIETRHVPIGDIVVFGRGIGASLAVQLCAETSGLRWLILEDADGDLGRLLSSDPRASLVPARMLFHENFPLAGPLHTLKTPKLLITHTSGVAPAYVLDASNPRTTVEVPGGADPALEVQAIQRFLAGNH